MKKQIYMISILLVMFGLLQSQSLNFRVGMFQPSAKSDLWQINMENLRFNQSSLKSTQVNFEFETFFSRYSSISLGIGGFQRRIDTEYRDFETENGEPIYQSFSLRLTPIELNLRLYPLGHRGIFLPYVGFGGDLILWKYSQYGEFINFQTMEIYEGTAITDTVNFGCNANIGFILRFSRTTGLSLEYKYTWAKGELSEYFEEFDALDLGGYSIQAGFHIFFR